MSEETWQDIVEKPLPRTLEEPVAGRTWILENHLDNQPETPFQALMEAAPHQESRISKQEVMSVETILSRIVDQHLTEEEKAVIETTLYAGHSIRTAAEILGIPKSVVHRLKNSAMQIIEREMRNNGYGN